VGGVAQDLHRARTASAGQMHGHAAPSRINLVKVTADNTLIMTKTRISLLLIFFCVAGFLLPGNLPAAQEQTNPWGHTFFFENDLFNGTDSNYTNGVKYSLISPDLSPHAKQGSIPRKALELIHKLPFIKESGPEFSHKVEFAVGQNLYTPADTSRRDLITNDRPYAGWSYFSLGYHRQTRFTENLDFLDSVEVQMVLVGPQAFGEEAQNGVHKLRDIPTAEGWDNQLKNEPGLVVAFERKWRVSPTTNGLLSTDAILHTGGALGNVSTYFNGGLEVRAGLNLARKFGVSLIRPAGSTLFTPDNKPSLYLFGAVNGKFVLRDIFLDGNSFADSHSIDKKDWVADFAIGATASYRNLMLTYTHVTRTKEFVGQQESHDFGSITLSFFYPFW